MESKRSDLRDFLAGQMSEQIVSVTDRPRPISENFVEGFVLFTNGKIENDLLLRMLRRYYPKAEIVVVGESYHWVDRPGETMLLINITNYSEIGGAHFWSGSRRWGGIGFEITEHQKA